MRIAFGLAVLTALGAATASAQPGHLTDQAYLQAARCIGLASSKNLGGSDQKSMRAWLESEGLTRQSYILDKGDQLEQEAKREADRADDLGRQRLQAELNGMCSTLKG